MRPNLPWALPVLGLLVLLGWSSAGSAPRVKEDPFERAAASQAEAPASRRAGSRPLLPSIPAASTESPDEPAGALVFGTVDSEGQPVSAAEVLAIPAGAWALAKAVGGPDLPPSPEDWAADRAFTDEDGAFSLVLEPGEYLLAARAPGLAPALLEGLVLASGEEVDGLAISLEPGLAISGRVWRREPAPSDESHQTDRSAAPGRPGWSPVPWANVALEGNGFVLTAGTEEDGSFRFEGLVPGDYQLSAYLHLDGGATLTARAGQEDLALDLGYRTVSGRVLDGNGAPVAGALVFRAELDPSSGLSPRDPIGLLPPDPLGGYLRGMAMCTPEPECWSEASTAEDGSFAIQVPGGVAFQIASATQDGRRGVSALQSPGSPWAEVRVGPVREIAVRFVNPESEARAELQVGALEAPFSFSSALPGPDGVAVLRPWPGLSQRLEAVYADGLVPLTPLPTEVELSNPLALP